MQLFDIIRLAEPSLEPSACKIHLATGNGVENPLDVFLAGDFDAWQSRQTRRNFERQYVISLIKLSAPGAWLFAGAYRSEGCHETDGSAAYAIRYELAPLESCQALVGRAIVAFARPGRQPYLNAEPWVSSMEVVELRSERLSVCEFPGYSNVVVDKPTLDLIVSQRVPSWRAALSSVAGVYLITDTANGKAYVGSAYGDAGIWGRWSAYAATGHGGNVELRRVLREHGEDRAKGFRYAILEIADTHTDREGVFQRESHWKRMLLTREFGYNGN